MLGGLIGKLFGTEKALGAIVESAGNALDALVYTDEEKAQAASKDRSEARQMVVEWMRSTQGQNLARRLIALSITGIWLGMYLFSVLLSMLAIWLPEHDENITATAKIASESAQDMNPAVMLILAFYFAAPHMGDIAAAAINKMGGGATVSRKG